MKTTPLQRRAKNAAARIVLSNPHSRKYQMTHLPLLRFSWLLVLVSLLFPNSLCVAFTVSWDPSVAPGTVQSLNNGSFESDFSGWTGSGNRFIESLSPTDGTKIVSFNGTSANDSVPNGILSQTFPTIPGTTYTLAFDMGTAGSASLEQKLEVTVVGTGSLLSQVISSTSAGGGTTRWAAKTYTFTANGATTTLTFRDISAVTDRVDMLLDNVRITTPNPNVLGYRVRYGTSSGNYTTTLDVGPSTSAQIADPPAGVTYYCTVYAYAAASIESLPSAEVTYTGTGTTLSGNADLSSIGVSAGSLSPLFASGTTSYTASVTATTASITVSPTVAQANATVKVNGLSVPSGATSLAINLAVGSNTISTVVTAQDGTTSKTYTLTVTRAASNNANLASLALSAGTLSPAFASGTTNYAANVSNAVAAFMITPTVAQANATVRVNGVNIPSGIASQAVSLSLGINTITVAVTAPDRVTTKTYSVAVTRAQSSNANLASLVPSAGTLSPAFASGTTNYAANVSNAVTALMITPTVAQANATVRVNGVNIPSGIASQTISLGLGINTITVAVTAPDRVTTKTYSVAVTRAQSSNANLASLALSAGTLSPAFASGTTIYTASVPNTTASITVTPTAADTGATLRVNGTTVPSGVPSPAITLAAGSTTITTLVTAKDGTTKTYTLAVSQAVASDIAGNYNGLATPTTSTTNPARHIGLGLVTVNATGAFTGKLTLGGSSTALTFSGTFGSGSAGIFGPGNSVALSIPRTGLPTLALALNIDRRTSVTSQITGTLTDTTGAIVSTIVLERAFYTQAANPAAPLANAPVSLLNPATDKGAYTAIFQSRTPAQLGLASTTFPQGDGWATLTVQPNGAVSVSGRLGDGQTFNYSAFLSRNNVLPLYLQPYSGAGTVIGSLTFRDVAAQSDVDGIGLKWFKPANSRDASYREGWATGIDVDFLGSKFVSPLLTNKTTLGNDPATSPTVNGWTMLTDGGLVNPLCNSLSIGLTSKATVLGAPTGMIAANSLAVTISPNGSFSGSFSHPTWNTTPTFAGVVLQKTRTAGGFFLTRRNSTSALQSGAATLSTAATAPASIAAN